MTRPLVRAVFAVLVVATVAAFFATQQLKGEFPLVIRFATKPAHFSPNGDDYRDTTEVGFDLSEPASLSFMVVDSEGSEVRRIVRERRLAGDAKHRFRWDGRDDDGNLVEDGTYRMRVVRRDESRVIDSTKKITVDRRPPRVTLLSAKPSVIATGLPGETPSVRLRYRGPANKAPVVRVFRTDDGKPHIVRRFRGGPNRTAVWDGQVSSGPQRTEPAPEGDYAFTVAVRDRAGNLTEAPQPVPRAPVARAGTGVSVRRFTLRGPISAVTAGAFAHLEVGPVDRSFDWVVSRLGDPKAVLHGGRVAGRFRIRIPSKTRTGVYLVRVRAGKERAVWPLAVAGLPPKRARGQARPLVVLPALTWQGLNRVDDDADGFEDRLPFAGAVRLDRPFADGGLPPRFDGEVSPLLRWLDRERLAYDLTTDLALARREGPALGNAPGVAFAGSELWVPEQLMERLRDYVADGGRVATFGADSFRRTIELAGDSARNASKPRRANAFGERTQLLRTGSAPLTVFEDGLGLFEGMSSFVGEFTVFEVSRQLPRSARRITAAGRDAGQPAFLALGLGGGIVLRAGTPQWARELEESALSLELPQVTKRIWRMLSAGGALSLSAILRAVTRRRLLLGGGLVVIVLAVAIGLYVRSQNEPLEKRGSATEEFVTTEEAKPPPKKDDPRPWPTYGYDNQRQHVSPYHHRPPYKRLWSIDAHDTIEFPPSIGYGRVYVAQQKGLFFALNAKTGQVRWRKSLDRCAASSPTIGKGVVYQAYMHPVVCAQGQAGADGFVVAWDARTGDERWRYKTAPVESSPLLRGKRLYFGAWDHGVHAINAKTGRRIWRFGADNEVNTSAAYWNGRIFIASDSGTLYALSAKSGKQLWSAQSQSRFGSREFFYATPTVAYGRVYIGNTDGTMYVFGAKSGKLLWARPLGTYIYGAAAVYNRKVFVGTYDGKFYALDAATGDVRWQIDAGGAVHAAATVMDGLVYYAVCSSCGEAASRSVARGPDSTYAVRARDGKRVWRFPAGKYANPVVADRERVYVTGRAGQYAFARKGSDVVKEYLKQKRRREKRQSDQ